MRVAATYSHKAGEEFIRQQHSAELIEVYAAIEAVDAVAALRKISSEKNKPPLIFSPIEFNHRIKQFLSGLGWTEPAPDTRRGFREPRIRLGDHEFREMDGIKNGVGIEVQFGKYAFMGYDIFSKMPIFAKRGLIQCGVEVVVMSSMLKHMSTGVSSFDQIKLDMQHRGVADLDVPTLVVGIDCTTHEWKEVEQKRQRFLVRRREMIEAGEVSAKRQGPPPGPK